MADYVVDTRRCTVLGADRPLNGASAHVARVSTVEHLLSAFVGMGIDNALVEITGEEVPIADGSAAPFCDLIADAGITELDAPRRVVNLTEPVAVRSGKSYLVAMPADSFIVSVTLVNDHRHPALTDQYVEFEVSQAVYRAEIASARTFGFVKELERLRQAGLVLGATLENAIGIGETEILTPLRFPNEMARHKALDLIGDLSLVGGSLRAHIVAVRPGHTVNNLLARRILAATQVGKGAEAGYGLP